MARTRALSPARSVRAIASIARARSFRAKARETELAPVVHASVTMRMFDIDLIARTYGSVRLEDSAAPVCVRTEGMSMSDYLAVRRALFGVSDDESIPDTVRDPSVFDFT